MFQFSQGKFTTQGHKGIPEGCFEEEQGRKGFFGQVSHLIKSKPSTRWTNIEGPLKPRLYDLVEYQKNFGQWKRLFFNSEVVLYNYWLRPTSSDQAEDLEMQMGILVFLPSRRGPGSDRVWTSTL
ncbi:MAG: hypothetical protein IPK04_04995 [Bdellovibrionales bacterium]|nr:hypothetical protein [Bdellovibrionales bacterium]